MASWRIQTCQYLEEAFPPCKELFSDCAATFEQTYKPLIKNLNTASVIELSELFEDFCKLARRLWRLRTNIKVQELGDESLRQFQVMSANMEAHSTVKLLSGDKRLDGRPICMVVSPRIVSEPIEAKRTGSVKAVIWSAAQVWVSNEKAPYEAQEALKAGMMHLYGYM